MYGGVAEVFIRILRGIGGIVEDRDLLAYFRRSMASISPAFVCRSIQHKLIVVPAVIALVMHRHCGMRNTFTMCDEQIYGAVVEGDCEDKRHQPQASQIPPGELLRSVDAWGRR